jgi:hypothetical protein
LICDELKLSQYPFFQHRILIILSFHFRLHQHLFFIFPLTPSLQIKKWQIFNLCPNHIGILDTVGHCEPYSAFNQTSD